MSSGSASFRIGCALLALLPALACGGDDLVLPEDGVPTRVEIVGGNGQNGMVGAPLADSLAVRVFDAQNRALPGQRVDFTGTSGGTLAPASVATDASGRAAARWTLGSVAGGQQVQAKVVGNGAPATLFVVFSATAGASAATTLSKISGDDQTATAGSTLPDSLIVRAADGSGNPVAGVAVTWTTSGGGSVSEGTTVSGADGRSGVRRTLGIVAGPQATMATAPGLSGSPLTFAATASVGSAGRLFIAQQPSPTAASGAAFSQQPRVQVQDANGNNIAGAGRAITAELVSGPGGATLIGSGTVATNPAGLALFQNLGITGPAGEYTLNFSGADLTGVTSNAIALTAGAASRLAFVAQPSNTTAGAVIAPPVRVAIQDALGQTVTTATSAVTINLGNNPGGGVLSGTGTVNAVNGVATFASLSINLAGAGYTLAASAAGFTGVGSAAFNVTIGAATSMIANSAVPATWVAGGTVAPDPSVKVTDGAGNPVAGVIVTFEAVNGGSASGSAQTTNAQGIATVGSWTIGGAAGTLYQLTASAPGLSGSPVAFGTTAVAGTAGKIEIVTQPGATAQSGTALNPQPVVRLLDANDNPVTTSGIGITASISSGPGSATLTNSAASTVNGVASFSGLRINGPSGTYALSFSNPTLSGATSTDIVLGSGAATRIGMVTEPSASVQNGVIFPQQPIVQLLDASGNPVGQAGVTITVSLQPGGGATLSPSDVTAQTNSEGIASYADLRITGNLVTRTLLFAAAGLTSASSGQIAVTPGPVSASLSTLSASPGAFTAGDDPGSTVTITARDQSGNPVAGALVTPASTGNGAFTPVSAAADAAGQAVFGYANTESGAKTISATADAVLLSQTASVTVNPAAPDAGQSSLSATPASTTAGTAVTLALLVRDQFGNPLSGANFTLSSDLAGSFVQPSIVTDVDGQASTSFTPEGSGTHTISATGPLVLTTSLTVTPGAPSSSASTITAESPRSLGQASLITIVVRDAFLNPVEGASVTLVPSGGSATDPGVTDAAGVTTATFSAVLPGTYTIGVTAAGVPLGNAVVEVQL